MDDTLIDAARHPLEELKFKSDVELHPFDLLRML
jgi:hypothetical protein